jgi:site-specific DNA-methyltransferase (adenine-specific)
MIGLFNDDCLKIMAAIPSASIDAVICDPPYGTTACKWDSIIPLEPMWEQLKRIIKPNGAIVLFGSQPFTTKLITSNMKMFKYCWYWEKRPVNFLNAKKQPMRNIEDICVFNSRIYNPQGLIRTKKINRRYNQQETVGKHGLTNISEYTNYPNQLIKIINNDRGLHPTQKPVALMEYLIKTYTNDGEIVLDFTMGSGTTGVAAVNSGRHFVGIELDKGYFDIAQARIKAAEEAHADND